MASDILRDSIVACRRLSKVLAVVVIVMPLLLLADVFSFPERYENALWDMGSWLLR